MWFMVAAQEIRGICKRWDVSYSRLAEMTGIDRHTLAKLNPKKLDRSIRLETVDRLYVSLFFLCALHFAREEWPAEFHRLAVSRFRFLMHINTRSKLMKTILLEIDAETFHEYRQTLFAWILRDEECMLLKK